MAHTRKDTFTDAPEWADHLRPYGKRQVSKAERREATRMIQDEINQNEPIVCLGLTKAQSTMRNLKYNQGISVIPRGCYCYDNNGTCPYWDMASNKPEQMNGYCWYLDLGDWFESGGTDLLWDQVKVCNIKHD